MTVPADALYDQDFYAWTQQQADLFRHLPQTGNRLDAENVAEEIEDLDAASFALRSRWWST